MVLIAGHFGLIDPCTDRIKRLSGDHTIRSSTFENGFIGVDFTMEASTVRIGQPGGGNTSDNQALGISAVDNSGSTVHITRNQISNPY